MSLAGDTVVATYAHVRLRMVPYVDPLTGRIVFSRWWRNFRLPSDSLASYPASVPEEYYQHEGLVSAFDVGNAPYDEGSGGRDNLKRNAWHLGSVNPDGTGLRMFGGESQLFSEGEEAAHAYGGGFDAAGHFYANFFPMQNMTEAAGFGGVRRYMSLARCQMDGSWCRGPTMSGKTTGST